MRRLINWKTFITVGLILLSVAVGERFNDLLLPTPVTVNSYGDDTYRNDSSRPPL